MSAKNRTPRELVLGPRATEEFFKPSRLEVYECLQVSGPATVAELASRLGRAPDSLYYHVRKLVELGVLRELEPEGEEERPGRPGARYGLAARSISMKLEPGSRASRAAWSRGAAGVLRLAQRDVDAALESGAVRPDGRRRNLCVERLKVRLRGPDLTRLNRMLDELGAFLREHSARTDGDLHALTIALTPLEDRTR